jgi:nitrogen-specific signal transduction histidine kinase
VQEALRGSTEPLTRRRVRLVKKLAPDLPTLLLDAARIRRVVANIVACALEAVPMGGRMRLETRRAGANVVLDVVHDRTQHSGDALEQLFAPFGAATGSGSALGLSVAQQIVREHGGEIRVRSEDEWSSVVSVTLPVLDNQDRRHAVDRRAARSERRRKPSEG